MNLRTDGFVYKVAYGYRRRKPMQTNLCKLFWSFWAGLVVELLIFLIYFPLGLVVICALFIIGIPFAARPAVFNSDCPDDAVLVQYTHWPKLNGQNIRPIGPLFVVAAGAFLLFVSTWLYSIRGMILAFVTNHTTWVVLGLLTITAGLGWFLYLLWRKGVYDLVKDFLNAKKQRACPTVIFLEDEVGAKPE